MMKQLLIAILCLASVGTATAQTKSEKPGSAASSTGICSYYSSKFNGRRTASGQIFSNNKLTAASRTYPFRTKLQLTNVKNDKTTVVVVNDRGPFVKGREISVTRRAAKQLGFLRAGLAEVKIDVISQ
jgi:rare lipoprotein A